MEMRLRMVNLRFLCAASLFGMLCLASIGCGESGATVTGKVVYDKDGSPMTKGTVMFVADGGQHANGDIQSDGTFKLKSGAKNGGLQPGKYGVCIIPPDSTGQRENGIITPPPVESRFLS